MFLMSWSRLTIGPRWRPSLFAVAFLTVQAGAGVPTAAIAQTHTSKTTCNDSADRKKFLDAQNLDTSDAYRNYLADYKHGCFAEEVRATLRERKEDEDWRQARRENTAAAYQSYIDAYSPNGKYIDKALNEISRLQEAPVDGRVFSLFDQVSIGGPSLGEAAAGSYPECETRCRQVPGCIGFTFDQSRRSCGMFGAINQARRDANAQSGSSVALNIVETAPETAPFPDTASAPKNLTAFSYLNAADLPGNDLTEYRDISVISCEKYCQRDYSCRAFTYNIPNNVCFLKAAVDKAEGNADAYSGIKN